MITYVTFKTKIKEMWDGDTKVPYIELKQKINRGNVTVKPHEHSFYNTDVFPSILQHAYEKVTGKHKLLRLDKLPAGVEIYDTDKFLVTVSVRIEI